MTLSQRLPVQLLSVVFQLPVAAPLSQLRSASGAVAAGFSTQTEPVAGDEIGGGEVGTG